MHVELKRNSNNRFSLGAAEFDDVESLLQFHAKNQMPFTHDGV